MQESQASLLRTPLYDWHRNHGARLVEFGGWEMPVQYTTIIEEHHAVRQRAGLFDISHMGRLTFDGEGTLDWLERVTTNHVARLSEDQVQYSLMANEQGGLIDDILVYRQPFAHLVVCNASNRAAVVAQFESHRAGAECRFRDRTIDTAMIAVQGPAAAEIVQTLTNQPLSGLTYYRHMTARLLGEIDAVVSRTGYTGEDGLELIVGAANGTRIWEALLEKGRPSGLIPCGLGARDTLRFEAGMPLYGHELSPSIDPFTAGVGWAVKLDKGDFVGRDALRPRKESPAGRRVGLRLEGKRIARQGSDVYNGTRKVGVVTSGTFAPTLQASLAMALVDLPVAEIGQALQIDVRGHREPASVVKLPFYRRDSRPAATAGS